ncbi:MAG: OmpH family outer membrane protein [Deltaproteobacteria bacterium]|nr:OmpH family outer membrane protein [Deltaproteobacteria bacterium]
MKILKVKFFIVFMFLGLGTLLAQEKIGYVDVQEALQSVKVAERVRDEIKKEFSKREKDLKNKQQEVMKLEENYQKQEVALTEAKKKQLKEEFAKKFQELQQALAKNEQEMRELEQKKMAPILQNMSQVLEQISKEKGYQMVVAKNALLYASKDQDLTSLLIQSFNKKYK